MHMVNMVLLKMWQLLKYGTAKCVPVESFSQKPVQKHVVKNYEKHKEEICIALSDVCRDFQQSVPKFA